MDKLNQTNNETDLQKDSSESNAWLQLTLRLYGDKLEIDEVTRRLGLTPKITVKKNAQQRKKGGHLNTNVWCWLLNCRDQDSLNHQLNVFVGLMSSKMDILADLLKEPKVTGEVLIGLGLPKSGRGTSFIHRQIIQKLAKLDLNLSFIMYSPENKNYDHLIPKVPQLH